MVLLSTTITGNHYILGYMSRGILLPGPMTIRGEISPQSSVSKPLTCRVATNTIVFWGTFTPDIIKILIYFDNPQGTTNKSDILLVGSFLRHKFTINHFNVRECTVIYRNYNTRTRFSAQDIGKLHVYP